MMKIIGIDFSTNRKKCGLTIADYSGNQIKLEFSGLYDGNEVNRCMKSHNKILIAMDAPLGWPQKLGDALSRHEAGRKIEISSNEMFRRHTDREVKRVANKQPMDVGADRIARTAHGALNLLSEIKKETETELPLAWNPGCFRYDESGEAYVIEVYPAVTLKQNGMLFEKYKDKRGIKNRRIICSELSRVLNINAAELEKAANDDNVLDSVVCVLSGLDFLNGTCLEPKDMETAVKEGWIWFKSLSN